MFFIISLLSWDILFTAKRWKPAVILLGAIKCIIMIINLIIFRRTLRVWDLDLPNRKIRATDCDVGQTKRIVKCIEVSNEVLWKVKFDFEFVCL